MVEEKMLDIDFSNLKQLRHLMDTYGDVLTYSVWSKTESEEDQRISINPDNIVVYTCQKNHHVRKNIYWYDGTVEETFEGRW